MKWPTQVIIAFICVNAMIWAGLDSLPDDMKEKYGYNVGEHGATMRKVVETWFGTADGDPSSDDWGNPDKEKLAGAVTTEQGGIWQVPASIIGGFLGSVGQAFKYILGFLASIAGWFGATWSLMHVIGIPQPWAGIISMLWVGLFLFAIMALITGRDL